MSQHLWACPGQAGAAEPAASELDGVRGPRVVYFAMKPQLRGRIRRNVTTLLELGADVTVLTVQTNKEFFVGLEHPRLRAEYLQARSLYVRFSHYASRPSRPRVQPHRPSRVGSGKGAPSTRRLLPAPVYLVGASLLPMLRLLAALHRSALGAARRVLAPAAQLQRWPPLQRRCPRWAAPWLTRSRRTARRAQSRGRRAVRRALARARRSTTAARRSWQGWRRLVGSTVRHRRRSVERVLSQRRRATSRAVVRHAKDLLRPWHRTSRFFAFWRESAERGLELSPDLVMSSDLPGLVGAGRVARRLGVPHVHDCHELYLESTSFRPLERRVLAPMERHHLRRADSVVAVNRSIALEYGRRYGREPVVVRNCAPRLSEDLAVRDLRVLAGIPSTTRVVLYQGGFSVGRGLDVCVTAVADLPADVHLVLLGFGPLREDLLELARSLEVGDRVHALDAVPPEELAGCTVSATVGLMPYQPVSRNNLLALPNKIFEYTAVGLPIVVSDLPELRRIAVEQGCGSVYDPFDPQSLARALRTVLDPPAYPRYRAAARAFGRVNVWENEREILVAELRRVSPQLRDGSRGAARRLQLLD